MASNNLDGFFDPQPLCPNGLNDLKNRHGYFEEVVIEIEWIIV